MSRRSKRNRKSKRSGRRRRIPSVLPEVVSFCPRSGAVFATPLTGRYYAWSRHRLQEKLAEIRVELCQLGVIEPGSGPETPAWLRVESLEVMLAFEKAPPCGCAPQEHLLAGTA